MADKDEIVSNTSNDSSDKSQVTSNLPVTFEDSKGSQVEAPTVARMGQLENNDFFNNWAKGLYGDEAGKGKDWKAFIAPVGIGLGTCALVAFSGKNKSAGKRIGSGLLAGVIAGGAVFATPKVVNSFRGGFQGFEEENKREGFLKAAGNGMSRTFKNIMHVGSNNRSYNVVLGTDDKATDTQVNPEQQESIEDIPTYEI